MKPLKIGELVLIEWVDSSQPIPNWQHTESIGHDLITCESVGWVLYYEGNKVVVIAPNRGDFETDNEQYSGCTSIPGGCIKRIFRLQTGEEE